MSGRHRKTPSRVPGRHRKPPGPAHWIAPGLVVVALLGAGGVGAHAALTDNGSHAPRMPASYPDKTSSTPSPVPTVSPSAVPSPAATSAPPVKQAPVVALRLSVTGSVSWIEVRRPSGAVLVSGLVRHGRRLTYRHGPLVVVIGNAGAVQVSRNGHTYRAGKPGEVVNITIR